MRRLAVLLVVLAGCKSVDQGAYIAAHVERTFGPTCAAMGYPVGSERYQDCKLSLFNADSQRAATVGAAMIRR